MSGQFEHDVIIIGAGLGGSACAYALRDCGLDVLILERGDYVKQEHENWDPDEVITNGRYESNERWMDEENRPFSPRVYYNVGGNSKFFGGVALRLREHDFQRKSYPDGETAPWPITYTDLRPYYDEAETLMWVHGEAGRDPTEPDRGPYPGPPLEHEPPIQWLADRLAREGLTPVPLPMAIDQGPNGRCRKGSPCDGFPCKVRAKGDGENSFLRPALRAFGNGTLKVRTNAPVRRLLHDDSGRVVNGVESEEDGRTVVRSARIVVLAAGAVNSAAILLRSRSARHPDGLANGSGQVGRNFMAHNNTVLMAFSPFRKNPTRFQKTIAINDFYTGDDSPATGRSATGRSAARGHIQMRGKVVEANLRRSPRPLVRLFARAIARRSFDFWIMTEDLADPDNRVELDPGQDGLRLSRRMNNLGPHVALTAAFRKVLRRVGLPCVIEREPSPRTIQHQSGTLRFGTDPTDSVLDRWCRAHELENLYVADGSFFPSSGAVNPALTIAANALRVGERIRSALTESLPESGSGQGAEQPEL